MFEVLILIATIYWLHMTFYYVVAQFIDDVSIIDIAWGAGPALAGLVLLVSGRVDGFTAQLITTLVVIWGARLSLHIFSRKKDSQEDERYQKFRDRWGKNFIWKSYFLIFMAQLVLSLLVTLPLLFAGGAEGESNRLILLFGLAVWLFGFYFESKADAQLKRFIAKKQRNKTKKKILTSGVWRYSRHPNYFGEVTQWWGLFIISLSFGLQAWWVVFSPLLITYLIFNVSGINLLEEKYQNDREWKKYKKKTPKFFPKFI